jgi:hypothetical protein
LFSSISTRVETERPPGMVVTRLKVPMVRTPRL